MYSHSPVYHSDDSLSTSDEDVPPEMSQPGSQDPGADNYFDFNPPDSPGEREVVTCLWDNCGRQFNNLKPLITHVHGKWSVRNYSWPFVP